MSVQSQNVLTINGPQFVGVNSMSVGDYIQKDNGYFRITKSENNNGTTNQIPTT
jgi:hypothetical protein